MPICESSGWIAPLISGGFALVGVVVGAGATQGAAWLERKRRRHGHWSAIKAEVEHNRWQAQAYLDADVEAPAYRLLRICYDNAFPSILEDGMLSSDDAAAVLRFYDLVNQMNYCLDGAAEEVRQNKPAMERFEPGRARRKAEQVADRAEAEAYSRIMTVIARHIG